VLSLAEFSSSYFVGFCKSSAEFYRPILCSFLVSTHGQDSHPVAASPPLTKFKLLSRGDFLNVFTRCSVKCLRGYKLSFDLIFIVDLARIHTSIVSCFRCGS
jgi:hypothetical protein